MRPQVRGAALLLVALAVGLFAGMGIERARMSRRLSPMDRSALMASLDRTLALDSAQHAAIEAVLARHQAALDSAWRTVQPGVHAAIDSSQMEIVALLRPEQRRKFAELIRVSHPGMSIPTPGATPP